MEPELQELEASENNVYVSTKCKLWYNVYFFIYLLYNYFIDLLHSSVMVR